jgi:hypothetical protein
MLEFQPLPDDELNSFQQIVKGGKEAAAQLQIKVKRAREVERGITRFGQLIHGLVELVDHGNNGPELKSEWIHKMAYQSDVNSIMEIHRAGEIEVTITHIHQKTPNSQPKHQPPHKYQHQPT